MKHSPLVRIPHIHDLLYLIRGQKVILGPDLAELYGIPTRVLMQSVRRNQDRFPPDFMFELTREEILRISQIVTSLKYSKAVFAFTEHGVAMLSGVLRSARAVSINIEIIRAFIRFRLLLSSNRELANKLALLESKYDEQFTQVFRAIRQLMEPPEKPRRRIGY